MTNMGRLGVAVTTLFLAVSTFGQAKQVRTQRRPALKADTVSTEPQKQPAYDYFSILDGLPILMELHHDTEVGTNMPVDVYQFVIELQVLNSDGNLEPEGLQIFNYYTARPVDANTAPNPNNARDCKIWYGLVNNALKNRNPKSPTWPYVEFTVAQGARVMQTNEDGQVFWSDDIECWGSKDRFPPF